MARVSAKPVESFCIKCGRMLPIEDFYKSTNPNHGLGVQPYCKSCGNDLVNIYLKKHGSMEAAIFYTCADMGVPFIRKLFTLYMDKVKDFKSTSNYWGNYTVQFQQSRTKAEKELWKDFSATDVDYKDIAQLQKAEKMIEQEQEELRYKWGEDKDIKEMQYLESRWAFYVADKELSTAEESLFRNLCLAELDIWEGNDIDKAMKRQMDMLKVLGMDKFEAEKGKSEAEQMIEYDIWLMENEEPAEYYESKNMYKDFRGINSSWIREIKRPIINLITGSKDYELDKEDKEEWQEQNKEDLSDE